MDELPQEWRAYAQIQSKLDSYTRVDNYACGLEAGLDYLLAEGRSDVERCAEPRTAMATSRRRERYRTGLRNRYLSQSEASEHQKDALDNRLDLQTKLALVSDSDRVVLISTGIGYTSHEIAIALSISAPAVRQQLSRARAKMQIAA